MASRVRGLRRSGGGGRPGRGGKKEWPKELFQRMQCHRTESCGEFSQDHVLYGHHHDGKNGSNVSLPPRHPRDGEHPYLGGGIRYSGGEDCSYQGPNR